MTRAPPIQTVRQRGVAALHQHGPGALHDASTVDCMHVPSAAITRGAVSSLQRHQLQHLVLYGFMLRDHAFP